MANRIIITDEDLTGDQIIFTTRRALPMAISGLSAGMWYLLNTTMSGAISVAADPNTDPENIRLATPDTSALVVAGHSLLMTPIGAISGDDHGGILHDHWPGAPIPTDFVANSDSTAAWELNGAARNQPAYDVLIVTEGADVMAGFPAIDSPQGIQNLQHLYWFGLEAQKRGAELVLYQPWSTTYADLDASSGAVFAYYRQWLEAHLGQPVFVVPAGQYVRTLRDEFGDSAVFEDGVHLRRGGPYPRGTSYLVYSFLTKRRCPFVVAGDEAIDQMAWDILQDQKWAGFGGTIEVLPPDVPDPLPNPLPLEGDPGPGPGTGELPDWALSWTSDGYSGPALTGDQPVVANGVLSFTEGASALGGDLSLSSRRYCIIAIRYPVEPQDIIDDIIMLNTSRNGWEGPRTKIAFSGWVGRYSAEIVVGGDDNQAGDAPWVSPVDYQIVEFWVDGSEGWISLNGNTPSSIGSTVNDVGPSTMIWIGGDHEGIMTGKLIAAMGVCDGIPTPEQRAAARVWAAGRIPA